jgi:hypothetical protein
MSVFSTIEQTFALMRQSWGVLRRDRELLVFPFISLFSVGAVIAVFAFVANAGGGLERLAAASRIRDYSTLSTGDWVLMAAFYLSVTFTGIFFNAALVSAALERLRGGNPTVSSGLRAAARRWPAIFGWALIATTVGLVLQAVRDRSGGLLGRIVASLFEGVWAYLTFFVVPVLVAEGLGPIEAIKRSGSLFKASWGQQVTAAFGFGIVYALAGIAAFGVTALSFAVHPVLGVAVGVVVFGLLIGVVTALEGIFKAALYEFASGGTPSGFERSTLANAYRAL